MHTGQRVEGRQRDVSGPLGWGLWQGASDPSLEKIFAVAKQLNKLDGVYQTGSSGV